MIIYGIFVWYKATVKQIKFKEMQIQRNLLVNKTKWYTTIAPEYMHALSGCLLKNSQKYILYWFR